MNMNPENLDQRINLMKKKIKRLDYDHEILNQDNTQLNKCDTVFNKNRPKECGFFIKKSTLKQNLFSIECSKPNTRL